MKIILAGVILLLLALEITSAIFLPMTPRRPRCMMVYSIGQAQTVKFDINLPELPNQTNNELYSLTLRNTETEETIVDTQSSGQYKRQRQLSPNVIYQFCIQLNTDRSLQGISVAYAAQTIFHINHEQMKMPENLLKKQDFQGTYEAAFRMSETVRTYTEMQRERDVSSNRNFIETQSVDKSLITISIVEIVIVVAAGIYQYFSLHNYLSSKQYI